MNRLYYAYARHALVTALRLTGVKSGDSILLPSFICRDVLASVKAVDAIPVYYDVDKSLQIAAGSTLPHAAALLAVNYFGFPADLNRIRDCMSNQSTVIIEDNAHGWLSYDRFGIPLGTRTALGFTSFRKTIRALDGAFLSWKEDQPLDYTALHDPLPLRDEPLPFAFKLRRDASQLERITRIPVRSIARSLVRLGRHAVGRTPIPENANDEIELPYLRSVHASSIALMDRIDWSAEISRRRALFEESLELAHRYNIPPVFESLPDGVTPQGFAFYGTTGNQRRFRQHVQLRRIGEPMTWPRLPQQSRSSVASPLNELQLVNFIQ